MATDCLERISIFAAQHDGNHGLDAWAAEKFQSGRLRI
jgi:hypothetical protein